MSVKIAKSICNKQSFFHRFVSMFVDTQKYLNELKEQRHQMFKTTAMEVMSEVVKVMNDKFESFDRR